MFLQYSTAVRGEIRAFIGFTNATTSESSVFFDTGFHDANIAELFRTHPSYTAAPLYFYRKTEIPADCESLASSITPDRLQRILHQAKISINEAASSITN